MVIHAVSTVNNGVLINVDRIFLGMVWDAQGPVGQPGIGARATPSGNSISLVQLGPLDRVAPSGVNPQSVATTPFPNSVDVQFQGVVDDANGVGIMGYQFWRDGQYIALKRTPVFTDDTVQPETTYNYTFAPVDAHLNEGPITAFSVRTPPGRPPQPAAGGRAPHRGLLGRTGRADRHAQRQRQLQPAAVQGGGPRQLGRGLRAQSDTPRKGGGLMSWAASKAVVPWV